MLAGALHAEAHNLSAFRCGNVWIGLVGMLYVEGEGARVPTADGGVDVLPSDGHIDAQLVRSRCFVCSLSIVKEQACLSARVQ